MYGLKEAGKLSNLRVVSLLSSFGFYETTNPCFSRHVSRNISLVLVVDDFGVKYHFRVDFDCLVSYLVPCKSPPYRYKMFRFYSTHSTTGQHAHYPCPIPGM
jgi:hypothetical protein